MWLAGITDCNTKEFFAAHKAQYLEDVRQPFELLLAQLAEEFGGTPFVFRPNRDVRFSPDKSPYKTNIAGYLADRPGTASASYVELSAAGLMAATGYHQMAADQLERYRSTLLSEDGHARGLELRRLLADVEHTDCTIGGELLKTAPRGVDRDDENIDLLRYKSLTVSANLPVEGVGELAQAVAFVSATWHAGQLMSAWLDRYVGKSLLPDRLS